MVRKDLLRRLTELSSLEGSETVTGAADTSIPETLPPRTILGAKSRATASEEVVAFVPVHLSNRSSICKPERITLKVTSEEGSSVTLLDLALGWQERM